MATGTHPRRRTPKRAARRGVIYGRQSRTREGSESLDTQVDACVAAANAYKVEVVDTILEPPSTSAYKNRGRTRPRFPEVLELIRTGAVDCVIAYKTDRLSRGGGIGWAPLVDAAEQAGLDVDRFVLIAGSGFMSEFEMGIRATMDREESKKSSDRLRDVRERQATSGRPYGGGKHPFGYRYNPATQTFAIVEHEAVMIRDAATAILDGAGTNAICRQWNDQGKTTLAGGQWRPTTLRRTLTRPAIAALRSHNGDVVATGDWEPILDRVTWERLRAVLLNPARKQVASYRENPLSRIIRCGLCGAPLSIVPKEGRDRYCCHPTPGTERCGKINITRLRVEELVVEALFQHIDNHDLAAAVADSPTDTSQVADTIAASEHRLVELAGMWADNHITRPEYLAARTSIETRLDQARNQLRRALPRMVVPDVGVLRDTWHHMPLIDKRDVVRTYIDRILIGATIPGWNRFNPDRVTIEWRN